jgi:hypothetical protein
MDQLLTIPIQQRTCMYEWKGLAQEAIAANLLPQEPCTYNSYTFTRSCGRYEPCFHAQGQAKKYYLSSKKINLGPALLYDVELVTSPLATLFDRVEVYHEETLLFSDLPRVFDGKLYLTFAHDFVKFNPFWSDITYEVRCLRVISKDGVFMRSCNVRQPPYQIMGRCQLQIPRLKYLSTDECVICLEKVLYGPDLYLSTCQHLLHRSCLFEYLDVQQSLTTPCTKCFTRPVAGTFSCPACRGTLE